MKHPVYIVTTHGQESSQALAEGMVKAGINAHMVDAKKEEIGNLSGIVFSYGTSIPTNRAKTRYNSPTAVRICVDKVATFQTLVEAGIPTCEFTKNSSVAKKWGFAICRESARNRRNEGMTYWYEEEGKIPDAELYVKWFDHIREYRVVVFLDQVFIYYKSPDHEKGEWNLNFRPCNGPWLTRMCEYAQKAAKALGIDYVGFDVLMNAKGEVCFLEGNTSPILCEEVKLAIINHFKAI